MTATIEPLEHDPSQLRAINLIAGFERTSTRLAIVTGGPGTGKTTCLRRALRAYGDGSRVELAAPTGKAAKRMKEATGRDARTVHRLLEFKPGLGFMRNREAPIDASLVIVDEASMLDIELGAALFDAIAPGARLILMGDVNQLPPVGPGQPFADIIRSELFPVVRLERLHRSALTSWIHRNAQRVLKKESIELAPCGDFRFVHARGAMEVLPLVRSEVERMRKSGGGQEFVQVLIPQTKGVAGIDAANLALQSLYNPPEAHEDATQRHYLERENCVIREGDRVIQTKNDYELGVFNGDVGRVTLIEKGQVVVAIDEVVDGQPAVREVPYRIDQTQYLRLAYALTIHRSQGSEFPWVIVVVHSTHNFMLTRQLLYTAITRAREGVVIVGDERGIDSALREGRVIQRNTTLVERLNGTLEEITQ